MDNKEIIDCSNMLKAIGNPKRLEILFNLLNKEMNVGELEKILDLSQSALSQHLAVLREEGIVKTRRNAQTIFYSIKNDNVNKMLNFLEKLYTNRYRTVF